MLLFLTPGTQASLSMPADIRVAMSEERHDVGDTARVLARIVDVGSAGWPLVDPFTVTARVKPPNDVPFDAMVTREAVGCYRVDVPITKPGVWRCKFMAAGGFDGASDDGLFHVLRSAFPSVG